MEAQIKLDRIFGVQGSHRNLTAAALGRQTAVAETLGREADENGRERRSEEKLVLSCGSSENRLSGFDLARDGHSGVVSIKSSWAKRAASLAKDAAL